MDLFFNVDWNELKGNFGNLVRIASGSSPISPKEKLDLLRLFYLVEADLAEVKTKLKLKNLNPAIRSESVISSLALTGQEEDLFGNKRASPKSHFRPNDYQYWLLVFLLLRHNDIMSGSLTLYQIIDDFVSRGKDASFGWPDIELTKSGATRCKTNLRFTFFHLKSIGLVNLYDPSHKDSWTLTFLGFFVAASICMEPFDSNRDPLSNHITRSNESSYYHRINSKILNRIHWLTEPVNFRKLVGALSVESLGLRPLQEGPEIFRGYYDFFADRLPKIKAKQRRERELESLLKELENRFKLDEYMKHLSARFSAEKFFGDLIKGVNSWRDGESAGGESRD